MFIHNNPATIVIELVSDSESLSYATTLRLPRNTILPSQLRYVVADASSNLDISSLPENTFSAHDPLPSDIISADLLVVPQSVDNLENLDKVLTRLTGFGKPTAAILAVDSKFEPILEAKGFHLVFGVDGAALYKQQPEHINVVNGVNGIIPKKSNFVIIEPSIPSNAVKIFSRFLQKALGDDHESITTAWSDFSIQTVEEMEGKTVISLLELETPLLENLSKPDFEKIKKLVSNSERILWITGGNSPSMAVVDGLSRTAKNENAGLKFQVLHLLSNPDVALRHGPSLAIRLATSNTKDDEFRERDGLLKVSRLFKSAEGNEAMRYCFEDSIQVQPLKSSDQSEALMLTIGKPGLLDSLVFVHDERFDSHIGEMEIEIDVKATGVK